MAKQIFEREGVRNVEIIQIDQPKLYPKLDMMETVKELLQTTKHNTVPQIFIEGKFIGGANELAALRDEKKSVFRN
jgi:glutaredoxin